MDHSNTTDSINTNLTNDGGKTEAISQTDLQDNSSEASDIASPQDALENHEDSDDSINSLETIVLNHKSEKANEIQPKPFTINFTGLNSESDFKSSLVFVNSGESKTNSKLHQPGERIGHYEIVAPIGKGSFGVVYQAKNLNLGRDEALKVILPSAKAKYEDVENRFIREIDIVSRLEHPNIIRLYNSGILSQGRIWMSMERIHGDRLDERLARCGHLPFEKAKSLMLQLLSGLMEAHKHQIVHRDLKPANLMLSPTEGYADQLIILDFGLSKALGDSEVQRLQQLTIGPNRRIYGSPVYMAPEQFNIDPSLQMGPWTDVYSAGLIFYEMLTGQKTCTGKTLFDVAFNQCTSPIRYPDYLKNTAVQSIIDKACAKDPIARYSDAGDFFDALQHVNHLSDKPSVLARPLEPDHYLESLGHVSKASESSVSHQPEDVSSDTSHNKAQEITTNPNLITYLSHLSTISYLNIASYILAIGLIIFFLLVAFGQFAIIPL